MPRTGRGTIQTTTFLLVTLRVRCAWWNKDFCNSTVLYTNPPGAPEDEVALVTGLNATGVMMEWERPILHETARLLLDGMPTTGLRVLNIGFAIWVIDTYIQDAQPADHVIIEAHPTCLEWMRQKGWYDHPGVYILEGRWQDFFPSDSESPEALLCEQRAKISTVDIGKFDVVYFDTFAEGYGGHVAFIKNVPGLLRGPASRFSYFNGHASGDIPYQVFMEVARLHHNDVGLNTEYFPVHVEPKSKWYTLQADKGHLRMKEGTAHYPDLCLGTNSSSSYRPQCGWNNNIRQPNT